MKVQKNDGRKTIHKNIIYIVIYLWFHKKDTIDLDLVAYLNCNNGKIKTVYFFNKNQNGIHLDEDNLTGAGDGDDETIFMNLREVDPNVNSIVLGAVIFNQNRYSFKDIKNAYCRIIDDSQGHEQEIARQTLSITDSNSTSVILGALIRDNNEWKYKAIDKYYKGYSINKLKNLL